MIIFGSLARQTGQVGDFFSALWMQKLQKRCPQDVVTWFFTRECLTMNGTSFWYPFSTTKPR